MLIIKFREKYLLLDNFTLGFAGYISTLGIMCLLEWRRKRKKRDRISKCLNTTLRFRGGDYFLRRFMTNKLKKGVQYEIVNPRLVRYIRELTNTLNSSEIVYIDLEVLVYAIRTLDRPRPAEMVMGIQRPAESVIGNVLITVINPIRTICSIVFGSFTGIVVKKVVPGSLYILTSIVFMMIVYSSPYSHYDSNLFSELPVNNQNIPYVLKEREVGKILLSVDQPLSKVKIYEMEGKPIPEKEKAAVTSTDSKSVVVEHKPAKPERKFNQRTRTLKDLSQSVQVNDLDEAKEDTEYIRQHLDKERDASRIRISTENPNSN